MVSRNLVSENGCTAGFIRNRAGIGYSPGLFEVKLNSGDIEELLGDYLPYAEIIELNDIDLKAPKCRDPHDEKFLKLALAGKADYLVTGDRDLLEVCKVEEILILTPADFMGQYKNRIGIS